jgi:hypothetical protein
LDTEKLLAELKTEKERLDRAIAALEETGSRSPGIRRLSLTRPLTSTNAKPPKQTGRQLTPEGRKRLSESMKKRWAERRKKA